MDFIQMLEMVVALIASLCNICCIKLFGQGDWMNPGWLKRNIVFFYFAPQRRAVDVKCGGRFSFIPAAFL